MEVKVTRIDEDGNVGVRESYIKKATNRKEVLNINYEDQTMSMDPESLVSKLVRKSPLQQSKYDPDDWYHVYYYKWEPNLVNND